MATSPLQSAATEGHVLGGARLYDLGMVLFTLGRERRFRRRILDAARVQPGERVLDVGCGTGTLALAAARRVGSAGEVAGIDPSGEMIARARDKVASSRVGGSVRFEVAVVEALPFPQASFDAVVSSLMFHHLPAEVQLAGLNEVRRVLVPGGRLTIVDFAGGGPRLHRLVGSLLHRRGDHGHSPTHAHGHEGHSMERVAAQARQVGFEDVSISPFKPRYLRCLTARAGTAAGAGSGQG